jgi:hypothetical protein
MLLLYIVISITWILTFLCLILVNQEVKCKNQQIKMLEDLTDTLRKLNP